MISYAVCESFKSPSYRWHLLLFLQATEAHSENLGDREWLDHINHILQQKVRLTHKVTLKTNSGLRDSVNLCI